MFRVSVEQLFIEKRSKVPISTYSSIFEEDKRVTQIKKE